MLLQGNYSKIPVLPKSGDALTAGPVAPGWGWDNGEEPVPMQLPGNRSKCKSPLSLCEHWDMLGGFVPIQPSDDGDKLLSMMQHRAVAAVHGIWVAPIKKLLPQRRCSPGMGC